MSEIVDTREMAQSIKGQAPPYECTICLKHYRSLTGIMYHLGQFGPPTKVPRCMLGDYSPQASPRPQGSPRPSAPASPGSCLKRKVPRRDLTWAEAQRMVEIDFDTCFRRVEIDNDLDVDAASDDEEHSTGKKTPLARGVRGSQTPKTPKTGKVYTPRGRGKAASKTKNKGKRKSRLKSPTQDNIGESGSALPSAQTTVLESLEFPDAPERKSSYYRFVEQSTEDLDDLVEYDMDEEDYQWLSLVNEDRKSQGLTSVPQEVFETLMDRLEKECFFESQTTGDPGESNMYNIDENAVCCICNDGECHNTNAILFCDMCNLAVHQECYGVPYIPEGQWLCRRCLQSPSRGVDCVLCPNKGGAFKQTVNGRWAHVICALWIPEVQFANTVFLEPIDGIKEIPPARWKLTCYICRKRFGACIQCAKANCYVAFHVTCAQQASLHMKMEVAKGGEIRKVAYCDSHTPASTRKKLAKAGLVTLKEEVEREGSSSVDGEGEAMKEEEPREGEGKGKPMGKGEGTVIKTMRRLVEERKSSMQPVVNLPYVPQHRLDRIISRVSLHKKSQFIPKLVSYWKLKRQSRNGVPLLRRLQASNHGQRTAAANLTEEECEVLTEQLSLWKNLRHDLERARLLVELIRKREKLKREQLRLSHHIHELQLCPLNTLMKRALDKLARKDPADIFAEAVPVEEVPDYLDIIRHPMDFGTMRRKVEGNEYTSLDQFEKDFYHVWHNATIYNQKDTIYYRAAVRIKEAGVKIMEQARHQLESAKVDSQTGLHDPDIIEPPPLTPNTIAIVVQKPMDVDETDDLTQSRERLSSVASISIEEQVEFLEEKLSVLRNQGVSGAARKAREKSFKKELNSLRRQIRQEKKAAGSDVSDDHTASPRRQPTITRNAEELASHVLHGSLRLTPSRQQILSFSGISLEERASAFQQDVEELPPAQLASQSDSVLMEVVNSSESVSEDQKEVKPVKKRRGRQPKAARVIPVSKSDSYVAKIKRKARKYQRRKYQRRKYQRRKTTTLQAKEEVSKKELPLASSTSEGERPINGVGSRRTLRTHRVGSSSSVYETAGEEFASKDQPVQSPSSDSSESQRRSRSRLASSASIPSASSPEVLTVKAPLVPKGRRGRKRRQNSGGGTRKKIRVDSDSEGSKGRTKIINGMVNGGGGEYEIRLLDLVWAKCRGYPPYPALVIDPDMPSKGMKINGERIQAPSDEVLELRDKNPNATHLVRFFDGRRTWQWLPPDKIEPLGLSSDYDNAKVAASGASKRSVQQAFQRAKQYLRRLARKASNTTTTTTSNSNSNDSDSDTTCT